MNSIGQRFSLNAHDTLVSWINETNQRNYDPSLFTFETPVVSAPDGWVTIKSIFQPTNEELEFTLQRVDLTHSISLNPLAIYVNSMAKEDILKAIFEQYGLYLDSHLVELNHELPDINTILGTTLNGFTGNQPDAIPPVGYGDITGSISISPLHPTLEGTLVFKTRAALKVNGTNIDSLIKLRTFYKESDEYIPWVETLQPTGLWTVDRTVYPGWLEKKEIDRLLHSMVALDPIVDYDTLAKVLTDVTGHTWVRSPTVAPFNVMGIKVIYNGTAGKHPNVAPIAYSYLMILELGSECNNLQGRINLAYQYVNADHPTYKHKTPAGIPPLG